MARILIIEDNPTISAVLVGALCNNGHDAFPVYAEAAISTAEARHPDLVVLDLWMAGTSGAEVFKRLRADPVTKHIPVLITSALPNAMAIGRELGADDVLPKPFSLETLEARVEHLLEGVHHEPQPEHSGDANRQSDCEPDA